MGIVWEAYHQGVPCPWGSRKIPLKKKATFKLAQYKAPASATMLAGPATLSKCSELNKVLAGESTGESGSNDGDQVS